MLIVIFATSLLTIIVLVISSASYLISLICDESDDASSSGSLAINTQEFSTTPTVSPIENFSSNNAPCDDPTHHHHWHQSPPDRQIVGNKPPDSHADLTTSASPTLKLIRDSISATQETESSASHSQQSEIEPTVSPELKAQVTNCQSWITTPATQKNIMTNQLGPSASKQLFDDFDAKEMLLGGTGLHWCKTRKSLDKLIQLGVPVDVRNSRQETALHVAVRKRKLQVLIGLLCNDAELECENEHGDTPLLLACKMNDIFACQLLLVFDADYNATDHHSLSARHYVAAVCDKHKSRQPQPQLPSASHLILAMLHEIGAKRCIQVRPDEPCDHESHSNKPMSACSDGCSAMGSYNGNSYNRWPNFRRESLYKRHMFEDLIEERRRHLQLERLRRQEGQNKPLDESTPRRSRMLCVDGGGMRGVISCQMLIEIQKYLKKPILSYFDWVGGTSVGAYLSCSLSVGTSLSALRRNCFDVKDEVFCGRKPYSSKFLERVLKRAFGATTRMSDAKVRRLAVTTVLADRDPCQLRFFRNYKSASDLLEMHGYSAEWFNSVSFHSNPLRRQLSTLNKTSSKPNQTASSHKTSRKFSNVKGANQQSVPGKTTAAQSDELTDEESLPRENKSDLSIEYVIDEDDQDPLMWQAVRASGAAPFFFQPYGPYLDGGIISNNPTMDMLSEFYSHQKVNNFLRVRAGCENSDETQHTHKQLSIEPPSQLDVVVSLGTGRGRVVGRQAMIDFGNVASGFATVFSPVEFLRSLRAARDLFKKLMQQSCQTEDHILDRAQAWCASIGVPYFRLNPPLASIFSIDDKRDEQLINALWQTKLYMKAMSSQLEQLSALLDGGQEESD